MYNLYAELVSRRQKVKGLLSEEEMIHNLSELAKCYGDDDLQVDSTLYGLAHEILHDAFANFKAGKTDSAMTKIHSLERYRDSYGSQAAKDFLSFHISRIYAYSYCWSNSWVQAVRAANAAISRCPTINGNRAMGLADVLIILCDAYAALNKTDDAMHSAKLAVEVIHDQADVKRMPQQPHSKMDTRSPLGPVLPPPSGLALAYFCLASQLCASDMMDSSLVWFERSLETAESCKLEGGFRSAVSSALASARRHSTVPPSNHIPLPAASSSSQPHPPSVSRHPQLQRLETDATYYPVEGSIAPAPVAVPLRRLESDVTYYEDKDLDPCPSFSFPQSQLRHNIDDKSTNTAQSGRNLSIDCRVHSTPSPAVPLSEAYVDSGTAADDASLSKRSTPTSGVRGKRGARPPNSRQRERSEANGDGGVPLVDEIAYMPPHSKARPKSAVSKLGGGYETTGPLHPQYISAVSVPSDTVHIVHESNKKLSKQTTTQRPSSVPGKQSKHQQQPYHTSLARALVESSENVSMQIPNDSSGMSDLRDALFKQLRSMVQYRLQIDNRKNALAETKRLQNLSQRAKSISSARRQRLADRNLMREMRWEELCLQRERQVGYELMMRAQSLPSIDRHQEYFEGMVIDVKRSTKPNSDRDRCVIIRARVNGTYDAENLETGELLINIQPSLIRIPPFTEPVAHQSTGSDQNLVFRENDRVQCVSPNGNRWFTAYIESISATGYYRVEYLDGSFEDGVKPNRIRSVPTRDTAGPPHKPQLTSEERPLVSEHEYYVGQQVLMRFTYGSRWRQGTIMRAREQALSYDVLLTGRHECEKGVEAQYIRPISSTLFGLGVNLISCDEAMYPPMILVSPKQIDQSKTTTKDNALLSQRSVLSESVTRDLSPSANLSHAVAAVGTKSNLSLRDRHAIDMHRGAALLNASAAERKLGRVIRHEKLRQQCVTRIQSLVRGFLARVSVRKQIQLFKQTVMLEHDEMEWIRGEVDLLDRYSSVLNAALSFSRVQEEEIDKLKEKERLCKSSEEAMVTQPLLPDDPVIGEKSMHIQEVDNSQIQINAIEKIREEFLNIHKMQLNTQRKELEDIIEREIRGLGKDLSTVVMKAAHGSAEGQPEFNIPAQVPSVQGEAVVRGDGPLPSSLEPLLLPAMEPDDSYRPPPLDIDVAKDVYLSLWGNNIINPIEVVSIVSTATVDYNVLGASIDNELYPAFHALNDSEVFKNIHWIIFVKDLSVTPLYLLKIKLNSTGGKSCKLKFPATKIADICESHKAVNVTLNEQTKFEICATSLPLDEVGRCMHQLWDAHLAWVTQKILISAAFHETLQRLCVSHFACVAEDVRGLGAFSQRFGLMQHLSDIVAHCQSAREQYDATVRELLSQLKDRISRWGYFPGSTTNERDRKGESSEVLPWNSLSRKLMSLAENILDPFKTYGSYRDAAQESSSLCLDKFNESLRRRQGTDSTVYPILKAIYFEFAASLNVFPVFEKLIIEPLMQISHQILVKGFAQTETYPWAEWAEENHNWVTFMNESLCIPLLARSKTSEVVHKFLEVCNFAEDVAFGASNITPEGIVVETAGVSSTTQQQSFDEIINAFEKFLQDISLMEVDTQEPS